MLKKLIKKYLVDESLDYKIVLLLLILKKISDKWNFEYEKAYKEAIDDGLTEEDAIEEAVQDMYHDIKFDKQLLWNKVRTESSEKGVGQLLEYLSKSLKYLADNNNQFSHLGELINLQIYSEQTEEKNKIKNFFEDLSDETKYDLSNIDYDVLMDYFIFEFSLKDSKKGGIYTPREIISLIYEILDIKERSSFCDPSSAYGEFMLMASRLNKKLSIHGQEIKNEQFLISQVNFMLNNFLDFNLKKSFALRNPIKEKDSFKKFDYIVSNPKWNQDNCDEDNLKNSEFAKERFTEGYAPSDSGDWAWIQHMIASSDKKAAIIIDTGALFRGSGDKVTKEKIIRSKIVDNNLIEAIVLLPEKLFYSNKGGAGVIIFFNKNKPKEIKDKILIVNAQEEFSQHPEIKRMKILSEKNIKKIVDAVKNFEEIPHFSTKADLDLIKEYDYNLNPTLYVYPEEKFEPINVSEEIDDLKNIDKELLKINPKIINIKQLIKTN